MPSVQKLCKAAEENEINLIKNNSPKSYSHKSQSANTIQEKSYSKVAGVSQDISELKEEISNINNSLNKQAKRSEENQIKFLEFIYLLNILVSQTVRTRMPA